MRFLKEIIIISMIILFVLSMEFITVKITKDSLEEMNEKISELEDNLETEKVKNKAQELSDLWKKRKKLEYYMEHDELEQISVKVCEIKANIEKDITDNIIEEIGEVKFRIEHIKNKQRLALENIF